jgi:hypothetical protein
MMLSLFLLATISCCLVSTASPQYVPGSNEHQQVDKDDGSSSSAFSSPSDLLSSLFASPEEGEQQEDRELTYSEKTTSRVLRRKRNRPHEASKEPQLSYRAGYFSDTKPPVGLAGLNDFVKGVRFNIGSMNGQSIKVPKMGSVLLRDVECGDLEVEDLTHDHSPGSPERKIPETVVRMTVRELLLTCSAGYKYDTGSWWKPGSHSGLMEFKLSTSMDTRVGLSVFGNNNRNRTNKSERARILSCDSETELGITLQQVGNSRFLARILNMLLSPLQRLFQGELRDIFCDFWNEQGGELFEQLLQVIREALEPYFDGTNEIQQVDRAKPQKDVQERLQQKNNNNDEVAVALLDLTNTGTQRQLIFDNFPDFVDYFQNVIKDLCEMFKKAGANKKPNRALFISTGNPVFDTVLGALIEVLKEVLVDVLRELLGDPEDILKLIFDFIQDIFDDDDDTETPILPPPNVRRVSNKNNNDDEDWSLDVGDFVGAPLAVQTDTLDVSLLQATLSGSPLKDFTFEPVDAQTLNLGLFLDDLEGAWRVRLDLKGVKNRAINNHGVVFSMPPRVLEFGMVGKLSDIKLDMSMLAAVPFLGDDQNNIDIEDLAELICKFFPSINVNSLEVVLSEILVQPISVEGFMGGGEMDELINSLFGLFVNLFENVLNGVVTNFLGTTFLNSLDEILKLMLNLAESNYDGEMCGSGG